MLKNKCFVCSLVFLFTFIIFFIKVVIWNMETLQTETTPEEHTLIISDVRFKPNSTQLATSSFDATIRLWDAAQVGLFC